MRLWERSAIVKIAIKRGVLNTRNERMAEELKVTPMNIATSWYEYSNRSLGLSYFLKKNVGV